jgi:TP901 family phage tail tape measure protein
VASKYSIEAVFKLIDKITAPTTKIDNALGKMGIKSKAVARALKNDFDKATRSVDKFGTNLKKAAGMAALAGVAAVGAGVAIATKQFIEFDAAVTAASAKFKDVDVTSKGYQATLQKIGKTARDVAAVTEFNAVDTAGALDKMAMAGLTSSQAMSLLMGTTNLATATGMDLTSAVDIATDAMGAFQMMTDSVGNALGENELKGNLNRLSDVMAKTTNMFNTDMGMMFEAIKKGAPTFTAAGQSVESFSAMLGVLANSGIKGSDAGTSLKNMMLSLANPSEKAQKVLAGLQIAVKDGNGNYLDAIDIIGQFEKQTKSMGSAEKAAALATIFGTRTVTGMNILLAEGADKLRGYRTELENAGGASENIANAMRGSIKNQIQVMLSALTELGFKFVEAFSEKGSNAIKRITDAISKFDPAPIIEFVNTAVSGLMFFGKIIGGVVKTAWDLRYVIFALAVPFLLYKSAMIAAAIAAKSWAYIQGIVKAVTFAITLATQGQAAALAGLTAGTIVHAIASKGLAIATGIATAAQWAFNVAATANPIGLIIMGAVVAVAALIAAIVLIKKNWDKITTAIKNNVNKIMAVLSILFGPIGIIISMIKEIASNWGKIKEALAATGLFDKIKEIGDGIKNFIKPAIDWLIGVWETVKNAVGGFFSYVVNGIKSFFEPAITWVVNAWHTATSAIGGFFKGIFDAVYTFVKPALDFFSEKWQQIVSFFKDNAIINAIKVIGGTLLSGILAPVQGLLEILSYIPGLGQLAGKGAEKIEEFRNFLKGVDGATVTANVNPPENVTVAPESGIAQKVSAPAFDMPEFALGGASAAGKSKLHGVVDIAGGAASVPAIGGQTATGTAIGGAAELTSGGASGTALIAATVTGIAALIRNIAGNVTAIADRCTRTITDAASGPGLAGNAPRLASSPLPRIYSGNDEYDATGANGARNIAPVTQGERMAYSLQERRETLAIEVQAAKGSEARIVRAPSGMDIELTSSGGMA